MRQQLNSVLHRSIDKKQQQRGGAGEDAGQAGKKHRRSGKRARKQQQAEGQEEERQRQVLAANLRYFSKTTTPSGAAKDLIAQVRTWLIASDSHCIPHAAAAWLRSSATWLTCPFPLYGTSPC